MRGPASYKLGEDEMADGKYDSADYPVVLESVPEAVWTLNSDMTIAAYTIPSDEQPEAEPSAQPADKPAAPAAESVTIISDDGGTKIVFNPDGTYSFLFESYNIEDKGTYTYESGILTLTYEGSDKQLTGEGDPIKLHYVYSGSDQLTGDYTIPVSTFDFGGSTAAALAAEPVTIASDDGGTSMTFNPDGTFVFEFASYNIKEEGTYTYADGKLTTVNKNGAEAVGEGDPIKLHFVSGTSDMLTGDYTIPASTFDFGGSAAAALAAEPVTIASDDGGTSMTFNPDGTFVFEFASYNIKEEGTYTYADGKLTTVNKNGAEAVGEGDPIKLHFVSGTSDMLTGDYTIPVATFQ